jgi:hypothetical protein
VVLADTGGRQVAMRSSQQATVASTILQEKRIRRDNASEAGPWWIASASSTVLASWIAWARTASMSSSREGKWP